MSPGPWYVSLEDDVADGEFVRRDSSSPTGWSVAAAFPTTASDRGEWAADTVYALHDIVEYGGTTWICAVAHTSGSSFDETKWTEMTSYRGAWTPSTRYLALNTVVQSGVIYQASNTHTSGATFGGDVSAHWTAITGFDPRLPAPINPGDDGKILVASAGSYALDAPSRTFTLGVDEGWDFGEGWVAFPDDDDTTQTNRAVATPDTIEFYLDVLAAAPDVDQTARLSDSLVPLVTFPAEFFATRSAYAAFYAVAFDMVTADGTEYGGGGGAAYVAPTGGDGSPWGVYTTTDPFPVVFNAYTSPPGVVSGFDLAASFGTDGVVFDFLNVAISFTLIRDLVIS